MLWLPLQTVHPIIPSCLPSSRPSILQQSGPSQLFPSVACALQLLTSWAFPLPTFTLLVWRHCFLDSTPSSHGGLPSNSFLDNWVVNQPSENLCGHIGLAVPATPGPLHVLSPSTEFPRGLHHPPCSSALVPAYFPWTQSPAGAPASDCWAPAPTPHPQLVKHQENTAWPFSGPGIGQAPPACVGRKAGCWVTDSWLGAWGAAGGSGAPLPPRPQELSQPRAQPGTGQVLRGPSPPAGLLVSLASSPWRSLGWALAPAKSVPGFLRLPGSWPSGPLPPAPLPPLQSSQVLLSLGSRRPSLPVGPFLHLGLGVGFVH